MRHILACVNLCLTYMRENVKVVILKMDQQKRHNSRTLSIIFSSIAVFL